MKNIDEKILMAEEEIKQLQNKRKKLRGKGKSVVAASAYRSGEKIKNEYDGAVHDFTRKDGIAHTEILLPQNAPQEFSDRGILWNSVEKIEKSKNSQLAREIEIALPKELDREKQIALVRNYVKENLLSVFENLIRKNADNHNTDLEQYIESYQFLKEKKEVEQAESVRSCMEKLLQKKRELTYVNKKELEL